MESCRDLQHQVDRHVPGGRLAHGVLKLVDRHVQRLDVTPDDDPGLASTDGGPHQDERIGLQVL
jgi:hypothetical protein